MVAVAWMGATVQLFTPRFWTVSDGRAGHAANRHGCTAAWGGIGAPRFHRRRVVAQVFAMVRPDRRRVVRSPSFLTPPTSALSCQQAPSRRAVKSRPEFCNDKRQMFVPCLATFLGKRFRPAGCDSVPNPAIEHLCQPLQTAGGRHRFTPPAAPSKTTGMEMYGFKSERDFAVRFSSTPRSRSGIVRLRQPTSTRATLCPRFSLGSSNGAPCFAAATCTGNTEPKSPLR